MSPPRYQVLSPSLASGSLAPSGLVRYPLCGDRPPPVSRPPQTRPQKNYDFSPDFCQKCKIAAIIYMTEVGGTVPPQTGPPGPPHQPLPVLELGL